MRLLTGFARRTVVRFGADRRRVAVAAADAARDRAARARWARASRPGRATLPPLRIRGGRALCAASRTRRRSRVPRSNPRSCSPASTPSGETEVREVHPTRDYTERMLAAFGWPIAFSPGRARLTGGHRLRAIDIDVPADFSSAAFFIVAATLVPGSELRLRSIGLNPRRTGLLAVLRAMGADIREEQRREEGGEIVADLVVRQRAAARHRRTGGARAGHDRRVSDPLRRRRVSAWRDDDPRRRRASRQGIGPHRDDGERVCGRSASRVDRNAGWRGDRRRAASAAATVDSAGDHRVAMSFAVAGLVADEPRANFRLRECRDFVSGLRRARELGRVCASRGAVVAYVRTYRMIADERRRSP